MEPEAVQLSIENIFAQSMRKYDTCCFSGHRPHKLGFGFDFNNKCGTFLDLEKKLKAEIKNAIKEGYKFFISGAGLGVDMLAADIVIKLKRKHDIQLCLAIPCLDHTKKWSQSDKSLYKKILKNSDEIFFVNNKNYFIGCMQARNKYLVDQSNRLIAVFNGEKGGTKQTIDYAKKSFLEIKIIDI